jgi:endonuclease/exonuclease/phosphatase family metal-dependent hydrolase
MIRLRPLALVAVLFVVTAELLRASGPLLDEVAGDIGTKAAAVVALGIFVAPGVLLVSLRRVSLPIVVLLLVVMRVLAQFIAALPITGAAAVLGMTALGLAVQRSADPVTATVGILAGGAVDLAVRSATYTWDLIWAGWWGLPMALLAGVALWLALSVPTPQPGDPLRGRVWCVGVYLALWTTTVGNPAFLASQTGFPLQSVLLVQLVALAGSAELVRRTWDHWYAGAGVLIGLALAWWGHGAWTLVGVVLTQACATLALARSLAAPPRQRLNWAYGLFWVLPVLLFQLHYDMPLPFDNRFVLVAFAVPLALAALGIRARFAMPSLVNVPRLAAVTLLVPLLVWITPVAAQAVPESGGIRLMTWNIKYGRDDARGIADPRQIAEAIRASGADVVVLQEVSRGWAIGGGVDVAEYLSHELGMAFQWGPAADGQFGNLLLTNRPLADVHVGRLPFGQGPMRRSFLAARVMLTPSTGIDLVTTHLTHKKENTPTRLDQIDTVLRERPMVLAGDLNFWPSWDEPHSFTRAGYISAQDYTGNGPQWTSPTDRPTNRVDWIWGNDRVRFSEFAVLTGVTASDHFPLIVTVTPRGPVNE